MADEMITRIQQDCDWWDNKFRELAAVGKPSSDYAMAMAMGATVALRDLLEKEKQED
jgi:hypothetical protein